MGDSPLSIAGNIAGLLTFAVAILAAIYVRYESLRNGKMEIITIRDSVMGNSDGLRMMHLNDQSVLTQDDEDDIVWLRKLKLSLYITDIIIFAYCKYAEGNSYAHLQLSLRGLPQAAFDSTTLDDAIQELDRLIKKRSTSGAFFARLDQHVKAMSVIVPLGGSVLNIFDFFIFLGRSKSLMRWYRVRERVLEKVREKENLQSRIASYQISVVNS
jgi:hypothetical protein